MKLTVGGRGGREEMGKTINRQTNIYVRWGKSRLRRIESACWVGAW